MSINQVSEAEVAKIWFSCLAVLHCPMTVEDKIKTLEDALISKVLDTNQVIGAIQTGLVPFDKAQIAYAKHFEDRLKAIDVSKISTGSEI